MEKVILPKSLEGKTVLVAGAAGFVPSHVCELYVGLGAKVIGLDNFVTGTEANLTGLKSNSLFDFRECNIFESLPSFSGENIDYIFSLASPASPVDFSKIPMDIMRVNSEGTRFLLELAKEKKARFLEASTSEVYGDPEVHPQTEDYVGHVNPIGPRACYDEGKRFAEAMCTVYKNFHGVETRIVRIFNTYGPRMRPDDGRVIPNFINQAMNDQDISVYGDGSQTRSFCFVTDLVQAMHYVMHSPVDTPVNIGNPDEYTILEAAKFIIDVMGSNSKITHLPLPKDDPKKRRPDITKLQSFSDYVPQVGFREGLLETVEFFKSCV
ncbi:MAG: NAD-dependent epimerase/dehydratase family protein [Bacteriovoracaceae bacterium]|nr:NAD-dependent epimerase/dehydratase family protein [Bacteriovoracaceae bacterium]